MFTGCFPCRSLLAANIAFRQEQNAVASFRFHDCSREIAERRGQVIVHPFINVSRRFKYEAFLLRVLKAGLDLLRAVMTDRGKLLDIKLRGERLKRLVPLIPLR